MPTICVVPLGARTSLKNSVQASDLTGAFKRQAFPPMYVREFTEGCRSSLHAHVHVRAPTDLATHPPQGTTLSAFTWTQRDVLPRVLYPVSRTRVVAKRLGFPQRRAHAAGSGVVVGTSASRRTVIISETASRAFEGNLDPTGGDKVLQNLPAPVCFSTCWLCFIAMDKIVLYINSLQPVVSPRRLPK